MLPGTVPGCTNRESWNQSSSCCESRERYGEPGTLRDRRNPLVHSGCSRSRLARKLSLLQGVKFVARDNIQNVADGNGTGPHGLGHVVDGQNLLLLAVGEDQNVAVVIAEVHPAVSPVGRSPGFGLHVVLPVELARVGIEAMEDATHLGRIDEV